MSGAAILIVEDERILARDLEITLRRAGYSVSGPAASGDEAIRTAERMRPDLIIMDVVLQGELDGFEAADRIQANLGTPVLFLSSFRDARQLERAKQVEAVGYLLKPWAEPDLLVTIDVALHQCRASRSRAQKALLAGESRFRSLFQASHQGMALVERAGHIVAANRAFWKMLAYEPSPANEVPISELVPADDWAEEDRLLRELFAGQRESYRVEQRNRNQAGRLLWVRTEAWMLPGDDGAGQPALAMRTAEDVTEQKMMRERLATSQRLEAIGRLAMGLAHNLGNELTPALVGLPLLRSNLKHEDRLEMLATMETGLQRGAKLIRQILRSGRKGGLERSALDPGGLLTEVAALARQVFSKDIHVETEVGTGLWPVWANADEIHQCLLNLCVNARDAMPEGGELHLTVRNEPVGAAEAGNHGGAKPGRYVLLSVRDTGAGVSPEILGRICEPFFTTKPAGQGTGLGLAMTSETVKNHRGFLRLQSQPGHGTEIQILLPAGDPPSAGSDRAAAGGPMVAEPGPPELD